MIKLHGWTFLLAGLLLGEASAAVPYVKVRIAKSLKSVRVSGRDLEKKLHRTQTIQRYSGKKTIQFNCDSRVTLRKNRNPILVASLNSNTGLIGWGKNKYRGEFKIVSSENERGCDLVNSISMETYISSLLAKEMRFDWPIEALKAQAVAARSYALHKMKSKQVNRISGHETFYDLENSEKHQVNGSFFDETPSTMLASRKTQGIVLTGRNGKITPIFFHSKCGGKTLRPDQVWGGFVEGYTSVDCPFCHKHGAKEWKNTISGKTLRTYFDKVLKKYYDDKLKGNNSKIRIVSDNRNSSHLRFYEKDSMKVIAKSKFRSLFGRDKFPSNNFDMQQGSKGFEFKGSGFGHGVGMCQYGAFELAKRGYTYRQILSHYFPNHQLRRAY